MIKKLKREQSVRVLEGEDSTPALPEQPSPADFFAFYPWACARARLCSQRADPSGAPPPPAPQLHRVQQEEYLSSKSTDKAKSAKGKKTTAREPSSREARPAAEDTSSDGGGDGMAVVAPLALNAAYDGRGRLVEVSLVTRATATEAVVPRYALRALAPCAPHQPQLARLSVRGRLEAHALRDVRSLLSLSALTEVRVEDSPLPRGDCGALFAAPAPTRLRYLALRRCRLDDAACAALASRPPSLAILDLSSNAITDAGAASLAASLRADRSLRYLNLSDNRIGDPGCLALLAVLAEFALTGDEIARERQRRLVHARQALALQLGAAAAARAASLASTHAISSARSEARAGKSRAASAAASVVAAVAASPRKSKRPAGRAGSMADTAPDGEGQEEINAYARSETRCREGYVYCAGNTALRCLNLAYNCLEVVSVRRLAEIVSAGAAREGGAGGLVRVVVEGNPLPVEAREVAELQRALESSLLPASAPAHTARDKKGDTPK